MADKKSGNGNTAAPAPLVPVDRSRILIVDDEKSIRDVFTHVLAYHLPKCRVDAVVNGAEAVAAFRDVQYGIILSDVCMPVMDGVTAFENILKMCQENNWEMPSFVFCTGYEPPAGLRERIGADQSHCILRKPVRNEDLVQALVSRMRQQGKGG